MAVAGAIPSPPKRQSSPVLSLLQRPPQIVEAIMTLEPYEVARDVMLDLSISPEQYVLEDKPLVENDMAGFTLIVFDTPWIVSIRRKVE